MSSKRTVTVTNPRGLHARPALALARVCESFASEIRLTKDKTTANGRMILDLLMLGAGQGAELKVETTGADEAAALEAVAAFFEQDREEEP